MIDERISDAFVGSPANSRRRLVVVALFVVAYFGLVAGLAPSLGVAVAGLSVIPIGVVAWLYGMKAGVIAGLVGFPLQVLAFALLVDDGLTLALVTKVSLEAIGALLAGAVVGRLRDLQLRFQTQAALYNKADAALLLESEITGHMAEGVFLIRTSDGVIVFTNAKFDEMFGYTERELAGKHVSVINAPGDTSSEEVATKIMAALHENGEWQGEVHNIKKDGTPFWSQATVSTFAHHEYGEVWVSVHTDITDRKVAADLLMESNQNLESRVAERTRQLQEAAQRLTSVISRAPVVLWATDNEGVFTLSEGKGLGALGLSPGEHVGMSIFEVYSDATDLLVGVRAALAGRETVSTVTVGDIVLDSHKTPLLGEDGTVQGMVGVSTVVTERELAGRRLTSSQARFSDLLEITPNAVISINEDRQITMFNHGAEVIFGYEASEAIGRPLEMLLPARFRGSHLHHLTSFRDGESSLRVMAERSDLYGLRKDGSEFPAEASISRLVLDGKIVLTAMLADVTERYAAERALKDSNRRLGETVLELRATRDTVIQQERLRALGTMAAGIAHDFNNKLLPITSYADLMLSRESLLDDREKVREYLRVILSSARDAAGVVGRLREFYRVREADDDFAPVDLASVAESVVALTRPKWENEAQAKGVTVGVKAKKIASPTISGSEAGLRDLMTNLIFNAVDAMPNGGTISISCAEESGMGLLTVQDDGIGMEEDVRLRCLEPFFSTKGMEGTGLGLAVVHGIVDRHGGTLEIESEPGNGTTVTIRLPILHEEVVLSVEPSEPVEVMPQVKSTSHRILVVDDDIRALEAVANVLDAEGHAVETAGSGGDALDKILVQPFDLLVTDRAMPGMNGDQLATAVKLVKPEVGVIMLTGFGEMMATAGEAPRDVDLVVSKPVTVSTLRDALSEVVGA
jgi:PAS domain S-box-containing protein